MRIVGYTRTASSCDAILTRSAPAEPHARLSRSHSQSPSMLRIYNTLSRTKEAFVPIEPGRVRMYVCGMTVYDYCHIGHARVMVVFDVVQRWLRASGFHVTYVRNITDIDDKIIRRAAENSEPIGELTARFIRYMDEDAAALGVQKPDHEPRATGYIPQMLAMIGELEGNGLAYRVPSGDVNYPVRKFPGYGKLSGKSLDELRAGERVEIDREKQDPLDFVLWKHSKADEPAWQSPFGRRPSGLAHRVLGDEHCAPRAHLRHPRRRRGPAVPPPRERDRAVGGRARRPVRQLLDAQRLRPGGRREDVEVARQLLHHPRGARAATTRRWCASSSCARTTAARSTTRTGTSTRRGAGSRGSTPRSRPRRPPRRARSTGPSRTPRASARRWTTTSIPPRRSPSCSSSRTRSTGAARAPRPGLLRQLGGVLGLLGAPGRGVPAGRTEGRMDGRADRGGDRGAQRGAEGQELRRGRPDPQGAAGRRHRPRGLAAGHDLAACAESGGRAPAADPAGYSLNARSRPRIVRLTKLEPLWFDGENATR